MFDEDYSCQNGTCVMACATGLFLCERDKKEVCVSLESTHMSDCGVCLEGYADCDRKLENGCEVVSATAMEHGKCCTNSTQVNCGGVCINPQTSKTNCGAKVGGACNNALSSSPNYKGSSCTNSCSSGKCT